MDSKTEEYISAFYSHKLHIEDKCNLHCPSAELMRECEWIITCLLEVGCQEIIQFIRKSGICFDISYGDVPQFSNFEDCVYKVPQIIRDCGIDGISYNQMGYMLRTKPRKEGADTKYGENHSKTAAQMGLCSIVYSRIYASHLGVAFGNLEKENQINLIPKLVLFIPYILNLFASNAKYFDVLNSVSFLSESTQKRRLTNIWSLINIVNKNLPYEFQIIRY